MNHIHVCIEVFIIPSEIWGVYTDHGYLKKGDSRPFLKQWVIQRGFPWILRQSQTGPLGEFQDARFPSLEKSNSYGVKSKNSHYRIK